MPHQSPQHCVHVGETAQLAVSALLLGRESVLPHSAASLAHTHTQQCLDSVLLLPQTSQGGSRPQKHTRALAPRIAAATLREMPFCLACALHNAVAMAHPGH